MRRNRREKNAQGNCYSIHTFELKIRIERDRLQWYKDILNDAFVYNRQSTGRANRYFYENIGKKHTKQTTLSEFEYYDNADLFNQGISDICLEENIIVFPDGSRNVVSNFISMRVNPRRLLGYLIYPYIRVVPSEDIDEILPRLIAALEPYGFTENDIGQAIISRLDICVNIKLDSQDLAEKYLCCLRKGGYYLGLREKYMERSETSHRKEFPKNEMRYVGAVCNNKGDCQEMSFYLKKSQMMESGKPYSPDEIHMADGQIRMEYHLFRKKIRYFENRYRCEDSNSLLSSVGIIGEEIMTKYLYGLYGKGKIVKTTTALNRISRSHHKKYTKQMLREIVEETRKTDMAEAFEDMPSYKKSHLMRLFNELDISPITIPDSWCFEQFENPVTYIRTRNVNERNLK